MRYAVTGATGWLGRAAVAVLSARGAEVVAFASRERDGVRALAELPNTEHDVLLHFAYVTRDHLGGGTLADYVAANTAITGLVRDAIVRHQPAVFYSSSGAAERPGVLAEDPYGVLKRLDEHVLRDASGGRCAVARVFNVAGPHVTKPGAFLLTDLVTQGLAGGPLRLRSNHPVVRSYVDVEDLAAWAVAAAGEDVVVSTAGEVEVEAAEVAELVRAALGLDAPVQRASFDGASAPDRYVGDRQSWARQLSAHGIVEKALRSQVQRTVLALAGRAG